VGHPDASTCLWKKGNNDGLNKNENTNWHCYCNCGFTFQYFSYY
jgi:hypothetical protein